MSEPTYTLKEIIEIQFKAFGRDLQDIKGALDKQDKNAERQFARLDIEIEGLKKDIVELKTENARYKTIWGIGATIGASVIAIIANRFI